MKDLLILDKKNLDNITLNFKKDGKNNIHILADFDRTLTKSLHNQKKRPSLISVLRKDGYLGDKYTQNAHNLFNKYHPIEINPNIDIETKKQKMTEWWNAHLDLIVKSGLHKQDIIKIMNSKTVKLRDGIKEFLNTLNKNNIPLIIISANGLGGDSIKLYLENHNLLFPNIHIISNNFLFDEKGYATGYKEKIIHVFNKDETVLHNYPEIYVQIQNRKNVILLGDSIGDVGMIKGFDYNNLIKIGFLNQNIDVLKKQYQEIYDIVSIGDSSGEFLNELLEEIIKN